MRTKRFLFVLARSLEGMAGQEWLDQVLTFAAFDQPVGVLFIGDGRRMLAAAGDGDALSGSRLIEVLSLYGLEGIWSAQASSTGLADPTLASGAGLIAIPESQVPALIARYDVVFGWNGAPDNATAGLGAQPPAGLGGT